MTRRSLLLLALAPATELRPASAAPLPDEDIAYILANPPASGLFLAVVVPGGEAEKAGLREGDILVTYAGKRVTTRQQLTDLLEANKGASEVPVEYIRVRTEQATKVKGGRLGVLLVPIERGKPLLRHPETPYEPDFTALKEGETFFSFFAEGKKAGFERHRLQPAKEGLAFERLSRFAVGEETRVDLRHRLELARDRFLTAMSVETTFFGRPESRLRRVANALQGRARGQPILVTTPAGTIASSAVELVALTMPRQVGACLHMTMLGEGDATLARRCELYCAAKEVVRVGDEDLEAFRYEAIRYGDATNRWWITGDHRVVRAAAGGTVSERAERKEALAGLPRGVSARL